MTEISFGTTGGVRPQTARRAAADSGTPMRILIIGAFSGAGTVGRGRSADQRAAVRPVMVDRNNFDDVIAKHAIRLDGLVTGEGVPASSVEIRSLEDFHPDALFDRLEIFASLRQTRRRLTNPATFAAAAAEVRGWAGPASMTGVTAVQPSAPPTDIPQQRPDYSVEGLFDQTLGATSAQTPAKDDAGDWHALIRDIAAPYALPSTVAEESQLTAVVDRVVSETMRAVLRNERFRAVEMAWRGVEFLTRRIETDESLKLYVLDLAADELAADLAAGDDLSRTLLYQRLVEETVNTPGGKPWGAVLVLHQFDASADDAQTLGRLAQIAHAAGAPAIAGVHERVAGCPSLAAVRDPRDWKWQADEAAHAAWKALGALPASSHLGLALPRILLRLPYGSRTNPTERFDFEELPEAAGHDPSRHAQLPWASAAIACGCLLGEAFSADGWRMDLNDHLEIDGLPLFVDQVDGEAVAAPCTEAAISDKGAEALIARGLMPLISYRDSDRVRVAGFRSIQGGELAFRS